MQSPDIFPNGYFAFLILFQHVVSWSPLLSRLYGRSSCINVIIDMHLIRVSAIYKVRLCQKQVLLVAFHAKGQRDWKRIGLHFLFKLCWCITVAPIKLDGSEEYLRWKSQMNFKQLHWVWFKLNLIHATAFWISFIVNYN